jgi:uncharacterized membrane protein YsdA (DUF1294 family)/cold shock CspA family protein
MKKQGKVIRWDDQRGFGFIRCHTTSQDIFFHIRDCAGGVQPPMNAMVEFEEIHIGGKGPRAMDVRAMQRGATHAGHSSYAQRESGPSRPNRVPHRQARTAQGQSPSLLGVSGLALVWGTLLIWGVLQHRLPASTLAAALGLNAVTFFAYWLDKHAAQKGQWRTKEDTLHLFGLAGGWPTARLAQQVLRHKTIKPSFQEMYWCTVWLHLAGLCSYLFWDRLAPLLNY